MIGLLKMSFLICQSRLVENNKTFMGGDVQFWRNILVLFVQLYVTCNAIQKMMRSNRPNL